MGLLFALGFVLTAEFAEPAEQNHRVHRFQRIPQIRNLPEIWEVRPNLWNLRDSASSLRERGPAAASPLSSDVDDLPTLTERVTDLAGVLDPATKSGLTEKLAELERTDSTQVVVLTVRTLGIRTVEQFANETFNKNKIGQADKRNGVLILVAVDDRKARIEVGYGLEHKVTDALAATILRHEMVPHFKKGEHSLGIRKGTEAVIAAVRGEYKGGPQPKAAWRDTMQTWWMLALIPVALISQWLLHKKNRLGLGCVAHILLLAAGTVGGFDELSFSDILASLFASGLFLVGANLVAMTVLGIFGVIKTSGSGSSKGWSWSSSSSSGGWSSSSSSDFSGGGGSSGGGGASASW